MIRQQLVCGLLIMLGVATSARAQLLNGDPNFPILNEIRWESKTNEVRSLCERRHAAESSTDSVIIISAPMLGFDARTEMQFDHGSKTLKSIQVKFNEPTKTLVDSLTSHFTRIFGRAPIRTVKEKSVIIMTIRMEMAMWRSSAGLVNLVTATRGDAPFNTSLVLRPPTNQQSQSSPK
jgi:hypothetical protein